jgi:hypothetical protein
MTTVVVAGAVANKPGNAGEAWVRMSWVEGFRRCGLDAWFVEELPTARWGDASSACIEWFRAVTERFGIGERAALVDADTGALLHGSASLPDGELLVNISGHARRPALLASCRRRAYVDLDPGYTQIWHVQGADLGLAHHDTHFTVGLNVGRPGCAVPDAGYRWTPVLPPVVLDDWPVLPPLPVDRFTTVGSWRGGFGPVEHDGVRYGVKAHELRRLLALPALVPATLELALDIHPGDHADRSRLLEHGWRLVDPAAVAGDPDRFRAYVQGSAAELSVAQGVYVGTHSGWFSDRTARYLASGRPALVQDTGLRGHLPVGAGLVTFATTDEAVSGAAGICADHEAHAAAARHLAEQHLDAALVLPRFLEQAGVS